MSMGVTELTCVPAYGRDYKKAVEVLRDWLLHKDFMIQDVSCSHSGRYLNDADALAANLKVRIRYNKLADIVFIGWVSIDGVGRWAITGVSDSKVEEDKL